MADFQPPIASQQTNSLAATGLPLPTPAPTIIAPQDDNAKLLDMFDNFKRESMEYRWIWEREWLRDLY